VTRYEPGDSVTVEVAGVECPGVYVGHEPGINLVEPHVVAFLYRDDAEWNVDTFSDDVVRPDAEEIQDSRLGCDADDWPEHLNGGFLDPGIMPDFGWGQPQVVQIPKKFRAYVAGEITGKPNRNEEAFESAEQYLISLGIDAYNPCRKDEPGWTHANYMRHDLPELIKSDAIFLLRGWKNSEGALTEYRVAKACGLLIIEDPR
jgi:uncharacterized protein DUF4406